jgi:hypothetical protein
VTLDRRKHVCVCVDRQVGQTLAPPRWAEPARMYGASVSMEPDPNKSSASFRAF